MEEAGEGDPLLLVMRPGSQLIDWPNEFAGGLVTAGFRVAPTTSWSPTGSAPMEPSSDATFETPQNGLVLEGGADVGGRGCHT